MAIKCPKCHSDNPFDSKFCSECTTLLKDMEGISESFFEDFEMPDTTISASITIAGKYKIKAVLGRGGMGVVYLAEDIWKDADTGVAKVEAARKRWEELGDQ